VSFINPPEYLPAIEMATDAQAPGVMGYGITSLGSKWNRTANQKVSTSCVKR